MRKFKQRSIPLLVLALLGLILGPVASAISLPCAMAQGQSQVGGCGCQCAAEAMASGECPCKKAESRQGGTCALHETHREAAANSAPDGTDTLGENAGIACRCALSHETQPGATLQPDPLRARALVAAASAAAILTESFHITRPDRGTFVRADADAVPGPYYVSRPDAGRAPPACVQ